MAVGSILFLAVLAIVHHPLMVSDKKDPATVEKLQQQEKLLALEMKRLRLEFEQRNQEERQAPRRSQEEEEGGAVLKAAPEQGPEDAGWDGWHCGVLVLFLLFELCRQGMEHEPSDDSSSEEEEEAAEAAPGGSRARPPAFPDREALERFYEQRLQAVAKDQAGTCELVEGLVNELLEAGRVLTHQTYLPQLENCIGVASAFEGWGPHGDPPAYRVLVPLLPPRGHSFHLEMGAGEGAPGKHGHVLVELECVCKRERLLGDVQCLLHRAEEEELRDGPQGPFRVHVLCSSSHLDVEKTLHWFHSLLGKAWALVSHNYGFQLLAQPAAASSCKLTLLYESGRALCVEIVLGVQRGDSLVFLASQGAETGHPSSTVWLETFAVQELLFFRLVSSYAPQDSCHLKCLRILVHLAERRPPARQNRLLTRYHFKTCLMHLLVLLPLSDWRPERIAQRLQDVLAYLRRGLEEKRLHHFLIGNNALPIQVPVPKAFRNARPLNLFRRLALEPAAHAQATGEFLEVVAQVMALLPRCPSSKAACGLRGGTP